MILAAAVILSALTGCGAAEKQASTLTVRVVNQSAVDLYGVAASYSANGETLGSKACERIDEKAEQAVYVYYSFHTQDPEWCVHSLLEMNDQSEDIFDNNMRLKAVIHA